MFFLLRAAGTVLCVGLVSVSAFAQSIMFVDMQRVIDQSIVGKAARSDVEAEARKRQSELALLQRDVETAKKELSRQRGVLSPAAFEERGEAVLKRERELARKASDAQEEITRRSQSAVARVVSDIQGVIEQYSKEHRFGLVIERDKQAVLYVRPEFDITEQIIEILNEKKLAL